MISDFSSNAKYKKDSILKTKNKLFRKKKLTGTIANLICKAFKDGKQHCFALQKYIGQPDTCPLSFIVKPNE